jgi:hypothetical protein
LPPLLLGPPSSLLLEQAPANIAKALQTVSEVKAKLVLVMVFLAFMSPSRLVFEYSIAERAGMGKTI